MLFPQEPLEILYICMDEGYIMLYEVFGFNGNIYKLSKQKECGLIQETRNTRLVIQVLTNVVFYQMLEMFKQTFYNRVDIGKEYFEGDVNRMIGMMCEHNLSKSILENPSIVIDILDEIQDTVLENIQECPESPKLQPIDESEKYGIKLKNTSNKVGYIKFNPIIFDTRKDNWMIIEPKEEYVLGWLQQ
uniref:Uncharacterized protein n=1 Tax=Pyramimonas orientalis virus TaxID=455367 RepID=A0A7M3UPE6_POV01|nr:hypothetical protein HWQ62_00502 [Pyramimonas orientalis virus]